MNNENITDNNTDEHMFYMNVWEVWPQAHS